MASKIRQLTGNTPIKLIAVILFAVLVPSVLVTAIGLVAVHQAQGFVRDRFEGEVKDQALEVLRHIAEDWARRLDVYRIALRDAPSRRQALADLRDRDPAVIEVLLGSGGQLAVLEAPRAPLLWSPETEARLAEVHRLELLQRDHGAALAATRQLLEQGQEPAVEVELLLAAARQAHKLGDREESKRLLREALARHGNTLDSAGVVRGVAILLRLLELEREAGSKDRARETARELSTWLRRHASSMEPDFVAFFRDRLSSYLEPGDPAPPVEPHRLLATDLGALEQKLRFSQGELEGQPVKESHLTLPSGHPCDVVTFPTSEAGLFVHVLLDRESLLADVPRLARAAGLPVESVAIGSRREARDGAEVAGFALPPPLRNLTLRVVPVPGLLPGEFRGFGLLSVATFTWAAALLVLTIVVGVLFTVRSVLRELRTARLKSDFVSFITHELKTPLTAIRTLIETLLAGHVDSKEDEQYCLQLIGAETDRLSKLVTQVLEYSRIERQEKQFRFASCDMEAVVHEAVRLFHEHNRANPREIEVNTAQHISKIKMDRSAMVELLLNLLSNAAKYSPRDKKILVNLRESIDDICVDVIDRGIGIRKRDQKKIFEKFFRADDYLTREIEGTGLGLTFARYIARVHNGEIKVTSQPSTGSTFTLQIRKTHVLAE